MKKVITYGTFDLFHVGHIRLLKRLRSLGDYLIVVISTDEFNALKGKKSFFSYDERKEIVEACKYVDEVLPELTWEQKREDIINSGANILGMGDDWKGHFDEFSDICDVIYLPRTEDISTTQIKKELSIITPENLKQLEQSVHTIFSIVGSLSGVNK
ncbi:glycerol-3-phosphate cytidylyltransferase [Photobacterium kishitanii]|uniref:Glycerol-3-phosphate cytidylyltransferase n=1 Tax=Photobacterium kishitanii TaxID=318456 RepID=A0AAX0YW06_9GAMM|nr:glycerol-3-phosphate cytidylyltransferase [Photobacterium kishitanii]KJG56828.1 glycerol-3-phosphate cytidylyltransferase [Photobacterium kishitanii]KJG60432.1 glycerol-3-phosphate cytidylyltransferase [Photobacterium kishitanii]KJG64716.1 glycerol-3-phosphate cytidylyltransferase [Photobacterium kishitanii]KJG68929.1 glycerol-3-phosphate cytidylyltransferase [Photobacterium kishitanii]PSX18812.1 glycerol-3-phosphate cytidylyltransferase [Photobacterium kishitanii]